MGESCLTLPQSSINILIKSAPNIFIYTNPCRSLLSKEWSDKLTKLSLTIPWCLKQVIWSRQTKRTQRRSLVWSASKCSLFCSLTKLKCLSVSPKKKTNIGRVLFVICGRKGRSSRNFVHNSIILKQVLLLILSTLTFIYGFSPYALVVTQVYLQLGLKLCLKFSQSCTS